MRDPHCPECRKLTSGECGYHKSGLLPSMALPDFVRLPNDRELLLDMQVRLGRLEVILTALLTRLESRARLDSAREELDADDTKE